MGILRISTKEETIQIVQEELEQLRNNSIESESVRKQGVKAAHAEAIKFVKEEALSFAKEKIDSIVNETNAAYKEAF